nr:hypothetical protein [Nitrosovibrio sp. Nv4]
MSIASVKLWNPAPPAGLFPSSSARLLKSVKGDPAPDYQYIALAQLPEQTMKFRPLPAAAGGFLLKNKFTPGRLERGNLRRVIPIIAKITAISRLPPVRRLAILVAFECMYLPPSTPYHALQPCHSKALQRQ